MNRLAATLVVMLVVVSAGLILPPEASAQTRVAVEGGRAIVRGMAHAEAWPLVGIVVAMFNQLAGLTATIAAGCWARTKKSRSLLFWLSACVAAMGGIWCAVAWFRFGWPSSLIDFFGLAAFAAFGLITWSLIALPKAAGDKKDF